MDIPFEQFSSKRASESRSGTGDPLDWHGLAARLAAAHATRQMLAARCGQHTSPAGSFAPALASWIGAHLGNDEAFYGQGQLPDELEHAAYLKPNAPVRCDWLANPCSRQFDNTVAGSVNQIAKVDSKLPAPIGDDSKGKTR